MKIPMCVVCRGPMQHGITPWHFICQRCGYESSLLTAYINDESRRVPIDEAARSAALEGLRKNNYGVLLKMIEGSKPSGRLLDVGAAHGWFVEMASDRYRAIGIEPDRDIFNMAVARNLPVRFGYFPDALGHEEKFDIIVFNDVIEHIVDIDETVSECHARLDAGGMLVISLPSNRGIIYYLATVCARLGFLAPFERMWQKGLPSPHVHYFNRQSLSHLLERHGFRRIHSGTLPSLRLKGLARRINYTGNQNAVLATVEYIAMILLYPWLKLLPGDIIFGIYRRL